MSHENEILVADLKAGDRYFAGLVDKHKALDLKIKLMESHLESGSPDEIEVLKVKKRELKEEINALMQCALSSRRQSPASGDARDA